jgi:nitrous oxide reductase accessory protein NosL
MLLGLLPSITCAGEGRILKPSAKDKCPVCGMFVAKYPDWTSSVLFHDGSHAFFDGPKDMFKYILDLNRYNPAKKAGDISEITVKDYYTLTPVNARSSFYVQGSDIYGPMGRELIPLAKEADAKEFMRDHKGERILRFTEVTVDVIKALE